MRFIKDWIKKMFSRSTSINIKLTDDAHLIVAEELEKISDELNLMPRDFVILCIGSRDISGDSLGPLVGNRVRHLPILTIGNLSYQVTGENLLEILKTIPADKHIIVVDASLGDKPKSIVINKGPIFPGSASGKQFDPIGTISILGIVEKFVDVEVSNAVLNRTDIAISMQLADAISAGINKWCFRMEGRS